MNSKILSKCFALFVILLFPITMTMFLPTQAISDNDSNFLNAKGNDSFIEDFTTTTYRDGGATDAYGWGSGTVLNPRNYTWELLDFLATPNPVSGLEVQGRKAYIACLNYTSTPDDVKVIDLSDLYNLVVLDTTNFYSGSMTIDVDGDTIYVGKDFAITPAQYLLTYDATDPTNVGIYDNIVTSGLVTDIDAEGRLVYFTEYGASDGKSIGVLDAEDPSNLVNINNNWTSDQALGLEVEGQIAYVAASFDGFYVLNIASKHRSFEYGYVDTPGNATDVIIDGDLAYLADGPGGVHIIDVNDPTNPTIVGSYDTPGNALRLVKQGNTLFIADGYGGVQVLDVADPANPLFVTEMQSISYVSDLDLYGGDLVVGTADGVYTYHIGYVGDFSSMWYDNPYSALNATDVRVQGNIAYVVGGSDGLYTLDISNPLNPILLDQDIQGGTPYYRKLDVRGNFAYVCDYGNAFRVYNISDPTNIIQTDTRTLSYTTDIAVAGDMAFIADGSLGVYIYNISDPYNIPSPYSSFDVFTNVTSLWVQGNYLYVVDNIAGGPIATSLYIYDISDIANEVLLGSDSVDAQFFDIFVDGDIAYTADKDWMILYDVTDPTLPGFTSWTNQESYGVWGFGPYCLSADTFEGVSLVNCTDINLVNSIMSIYPNATGALQVTTHGDYTYVANTSSLVILRHFESAGATFDPGTSIAQSLEVDSATGDDIKLATLTTEHFIPPGTGIDYYMSADGGAHWEAVTPGVEHEFVFSGDDLRWKAEITGPKDRSAHIYQITIDYFFNEAPSIPTINDPGDVIQVGSVEVNWSTSTDDAGIDHYELQMDNETGFTTPVYTFNVPGLSQVRVRAVDIYDLAGGWSAVVNLTVDIPPTSTPLDLPWWVYVIIGGGLLLITAIVVVIVVVRKRKVVTR